MLAIVRISDIVSVRKCDAGSLLDDGELRVFGGFRSFVDSTVAAVGASLASLWVCGVDLEKKDLIHRHSRLSIFLIWSFYKIA